MQRRIRPAKLQENYYGTLFPKPAERVVDMSVLDGGLNMWELPYRMDKNQSPDLLNVYWKDGCLRSRPGQKEYFDFTDLPGLTGEVHKCYERLWHGRIVAHVGAYLVTVDPNAPDPQPVVDYDWISGPEDSDKGAGFFVFDNKLYAIVGGGFWVIDSDFNITGVEAPNVVFVPTVVMNMRPNGLGGTSYQPENRVTGYKKILYTSDGTSTDYQLPYKDISTIPPVTVRVNVYDSATQTYSWETLVQGTDYTVNAVDGVVSFTTAPAQEDPENPNNVEIQIHKANADAEASILESTCLTVYGGDTDLAVVVGGCPAQPNAYFWSGNSHLSVDPTYFPMDYYNLAGADAGNKITGFGRQQGMLIIFQEHSIGKSSFKDETINDRIYLTLNYTNINSKIGCNVPGSIQLVDNNLVFCNSYGGVYVLSNTTTADENNVRRISLNVNGGSGRGLLTEDFVAATVASFDDNERYWLMVNGHTYVWDYSLRGYRAYEANLSWFYFENILAAGAIQLESGEHLYYRRDGIVVRFTPKEFNDFGEAIPRKYVFAVQYFGTYEVLKSVMKIVFAVRSDTRSLLNLHYQTDWEERDDRTPIDISPEGINMLPYDFTNGYNLTSTVYAGSTVRIPRCFHIRHFGMTIYNNELNTDIGVVSAQIFYRYEREIR